MIVVSPYPIFLDLLYPVSMSVSYLCPAPVSVQHSCKLYLQKLLLEFYSYEPFDTSHHQSCKSKKPSFKFMDEVQCEKILN